MNVALRATLVTSLALTLGCAGAITTYKVGQQPDTGTGKLACVAAYAAAGVVDGYAASRVYQESDYTPGMSRDDVDVPAAGAAWFGAGAVAAAVGLIRCARSQTAEAQLPRPASPLDHTGIYIAGEVHLPTPRLPKRGARSDFQQSRWLDANFTKIERTTCPEGQAGYAVSWKIEGKLVKVCWPHSSINPGNRRHSNRMCIVRGPTRASRKPDSIRVPCQMSRSSLPNIWRYIMNMEGQHASDRAAEQGMLTAITGSGGSGSLRAPRPRAGVPRGTTRAGRPASNKALKNARGGSNWGPNNTRITDAQHRAIKDKLDEIARVPGSTGDAARHLQRTLARTMSLTVSPIIQSSSRQWVIPLPEYGKRAVITVRHGSSSTISVRIDPI